MHDATTIQGLRAKYEALQPLLDERLRRQWAATEARALGWGGITALSTATGLARNTIAAGIAGVEGRARSRGFPSPRLRRPGGGRKPLTETDPGLAAALDQLV